MSIIVLPEHGYAQTPASKPNDGTNEGIWAATPAEGEELKETPQY